MELDFNTVAVDEKDVIKPRRLWDYQTNPITINDVEIGQCIYVVPEDDTVIISLVVTSVSPSLNELTGDIVDMDGCVCQIEAWDREEKVWIKISDDASVEEVIAREVIRLGDVIKLTIPGSGKPADYNPDGTEDPNGIYMYAEPLVFDIDGELNDDGPIMIPVSALYEWIHKYKMSIGDFTSLLAAK